MDIYGLLPKFKLNRPLNDAELAGKLEQTTRLDFSTDQLMPDLKVIAINSHYMEMVDKFYSAKGNLSLLGFLGSCAFLGSSLWFIIDMFLHSDFSISNVLFTIAILAMFLPMGLWMLYLLKAEWFAWTHYPIRFDRQNQLVHATRTDGSVFTAPWQHIFFTTGLNHRKEFGKDYYISGHVLAEDGITVLDTFCLPASHDNIEYLRAHWEFIRRYMTEGPEELLPLIPMCLPIANKKASYAFTYFYSFAQYNGSPILLLPLTLPLAFVYSLPRYMAILTSRRPVWPESVQALSQIAQDDPYRLDASTNPKSLWSLLF